MRLIRLLLILLISISLPFANVAAAAMQHCVQESSASSAVSIDDTQLSGQPAERAGIHVKSTADHHSHDSSGHSELACSSCSYCQSCAAAIVPQLDNRSIRLAAPLLVKTMVTDLVPRTFLEQPFRPPSHAFA